MMHPSTATLLIGIILAWVCSVNAQSCYWINVPMTVCTQCLTTTEGQIICPTCPQSFWFSNYCQALYCGTSQPANIACVANFTGKGAAVVATITIGSLLIIGVIVLIITRTFPRKSGGYFSKIEMQQAPAVSNIPPVGVSVV